MIRWLHISLIGLFVMVIGVTAQDDEAALSQIGALHVYTGPLDAVAFSPDGDLMVSGGRDNTVRLWDTESGENIQTFDTHTGWVTSVAVSPDGKFIASGSRDNMVYVWDIQSGDLVYVVSDHEDHITGLAFTPDSAVLASGSRDGTIRLQHLESNTTIATLDNYGGPVWDIAFSPDGQSLASASEDGVIWLWGLWGDEGVWLTSLTSHIGPVVRLSFSPDGETLLSGGLDGTLRLWNITNAAGAENIEESTVMEGHIAPVMGIAFTAEAELAMSASLDGTIRLWDVSGTVRLGKEMAIIKGDGTPLTHLTLNSTRNIAASVGTDGVLRLWDTGKETIDTIMDSQKPAEFIASSKLTGREQWDQSSQAAGQPVPKEEQQVAISPQFPAAAGPILMIPSANIYSPITTFPLDGVSWAIDPWEPLVGHLQGTAWLNTIGNMALGAHSAYPDGAAGLFANLYGVNIGDEIAIQDGDSTRRYVVIDIRVVAYDDLSVIYPTSHDRLTLITCDIPSFQPVANFYAERLVVIADRTE